MDNFDLVVYSNHFLLYFLYHFIIFYWPQ